jgi:hypothetical protein
MDQWGEGTPIDPSKSPIAFDALIDSFSAVSRTMELLKVEVTLPATANAPTGSWTALSKRFLKLERRCRKFAAGTPLRADHDRNLTLAYVGCLKEAGERWVSQFSTPVDLSAALLKGFLTSSAFVLNFLDRLSNVGDQLFEYSETLSSLMGGQLSGNIETTAEIAGLGDLAEDVNNIFNFAQNVKTPSKQRANPPSQLSSDEDEPCPQTPKKRKAKKAPANGPGTTMRVNIIGADADQLVLRHDSNGKHHTSKKKKHNTHITVGCDTASLKSLTAVYGKGICPAALVSRKRGLDRLRACDCSGLEGHSSTSSVSHLLPAQSGPNHLSSWRKVLAWKP